MIAVDQHPPVAQIVPGIVRKWKGSRAQPQMPQEAVMRDPAERDEHAKLGQRIELRGQEAAAGVDLGWRRLVLRRQVLDRIDDDNALEFQPVIDPRLVCAARQTELREGRKQQVARIITGERAARAVRSVHAGGQPDNAQPGVRIAKGGDRRVPPFGVPGLAFAAQRDEARAQQAIDRGFGMRNGA